MPILDTSGMIGRRLHAGRNPPAGFLRSELDDLYQSACAVGAIVSHAESIRTLALRNPLALRDHHWSRPSCEIRRSGASPGQSA